MRRVERWLALLDSGRCACSGCNGKLTDSRYPGWRRCVKCDCHWTVSMIGNQRREGVYRSQGCRERLQGNTDRQEITT